MNGKTDRYVLYWMDENDWKRGVQMPYQVLGIAILLMFYTCYILKMLSQRKKGIQTDQMGKGKTGPARTIEITVKAASYLAAIAGVASVLRGTTALPAGVRILGACVGLMGDAVFIAAVITMRDSWRAGVAAGEKTELVTNGIYRISRNPAFLGFDLVYVGILLMFFNWPLCALSAFAVVMFHLQIVRVEEVFLRSAFGAEYAAYEGKVHRYLGRK